MRDCLGLSVGTTNLVAVTDQAPVIRRAALTLYPHRGPEVGAPPDGRACDGLTISEFVARVGDPVPLIAADGSAHRAERLLAAAVRAMTRLAAPDALPENQVVAVPAHWQPAAYDAVRTALPGVRVVSDAVAALTAIQTHPGLPARGIVALCDFGATGTTLTLADAAAGFAPLGSVRHEDFSGALIDQELLRRVLADQDAEPAGTSAVSALTALREECRLAKERLSYQGATGLTGPAAGTSRLTRADVEAVVAVPLGGVIDALHDLLRRCGVHPAQLTALVTVGGGARIPVVTQRLSEEFRMPVTTVVQSQVIAAIGAALLAHRGEDQTVTRRVAPPAAQSPSSAGAFATTTAGPTWVPPLAWSAVGDRGDEVDAELGAEAVTASAARPDLVFAEPPATDPEPTRRWYRRGGVVLYAALFLAVVGTVGLIYSVRADRLDAAAVDSPLTPRTAPAESPLAQSLPAPPTRTVVVQEPAAPARSAPRPAAAPRLVQSGQVARQPAPNAPARPAPRAAAPAPQPGPPPAAAPVPQWPVLPQLPIPTFVFPGPPASTPAPTTEPEPTPSPTAEPQPDPTQQPEPTTEPEPSVTAEPEPSVTAEPQPEPTSEPAPAQPATETSEPPAP
ncbi:Hsp70 family protein [Mycolicibacterium goodii]|uniref:Molecular chaperone n=1 Tax=Mycolicibacterium goodii TaxID=134601 RepID=A0A0K0X0L0_MYCGD|nr:hypothetical protein AFA91_01925 [Mycolicibacterium goodii]